MAAVTTTDESLLLDDDDDVVSSAVGRLELRRITETPLGEEEFGVAVLF